MEVTRTSIQNSSPYVYHSTGHVHPLPQLKLVAEFSIDSPSHSNKPTTQRRAWATADGYYNLVLAEVCSLPVLSFYMFRPIVCQGCSLGLERLGLISVL